MEFDWLKKVDSNDLLFIFLVIVFLYQFHFPRVPFSQLYLYCILIWCQLSKLYVDKTSQDYRNLQLSKWCQPTIFIYLKKKELQTQAPRIGAGSFISLIISNRLLKFSYLWIESC